MIAFAIIVVIPEANDEPETEKKNGKGNISFAKVFQVRSVITLIFNMLNFKEY